MITTHTAVGIDIGRTTCHIAIQAPGSSRPTSSTAPRDTTAAAILAALADATGSATIALELTGNLALPVIAGLDGHGHTILIAQHTDTAALRTILRSRRKTDRLDAQLLARMAALSQEPSTAALLAPYLTPWETIAPTISGRATVRHYQRLIRERTRLTLMRSAASSPAQQADLDAIRATVETRIAAATTTITTTTSPAAALLATIPGISPRRAAIIDAAIGDATRFASADKAVSYLGLTPPHRPQSGQTTRPPVRRRGVDLLHTELHMWALGIARTAARDPSASPFTRTYTRIKARTGSGRPAMWAAKRQLIRTCWGILTSGTPYTDPAHPAAAGAPATTSPPAPAADRGST